MLIIYKRLTFRPGGLHQSQVVCSLQLAIMHVIYRAHIDIIKLHCSIKIVGGACSAGKASEVDGLEAVGSLIHSRRPERLQRPNPSTLPDFS